MANSTRQTIRRCQVRSFNDRHPGPLHRPGRKHRVYYARIHGCRVQMWRDDHDRTWRAWLKHPAMGSFTRYLGGGSPRRAWASLRRMAASLSEAAHEESIARMEAEAFPAGGPS